MKDKFRKLTNDELANIIKYEVHNEFTAMNPRCRLFNIGKRHYNYGPAENTNGDFDVLNIETMTYFDVVEYNSIKSQCELSQFEAALNGSL
jgi:hypothetical protein